MTAKIIAYILIGICLGPIFSVGVTPIFCLLRKIFYVPFIRKSLIEKAERKGHVVQATLQKHHTINNHENGFGPVPTMREMGTYVYTVGGKTYKYQHITAHGLHDTLTLYYIKKPRKATVGGDLGNWETPWLKFYLIISLLITIATFVVGMMIG